MSSLSVRNLTFRLPDGRVLFDEIDLSFGPERTGLVGRNGVGKSTLLALLAGEVQPFAGSVERKGRVSVQRQLPDVEKGETLADLFGIADQLRMAARALAGEADVDDISEIDWTLEERVDAALSRVGLAGIAPMRPLSSLSGGQRTRAALAALVFDAPDMILLDEPTNNLDAEGRALVANLLDNWKSGAVIVSHDRDLLRRMDRIVELSPLGAKIYGGNFDAYQAARDAERETAQRQLQSAEAQAKQTARDAQIAREKQDRRDARGRKSRKMSSDPKILLDARQQRAEATAGRGNRLAERQSDEAARALDEARQQVERVVPFGAGMGSARVPSGRVLIALDGVSAGREGRAVVADVSLSIVGPERVALAGPNGSGKSTLLATIMGNLPPVSGDVRGSDRTILLDQDVSLLDPGQTIVENYRRLNPQSSENDCRAALARFMFRADAALARVCDLSGGERLRAGLACVSSGTQAPDLLMLDEPTNHLDLDSIAAVEDGLKAFEGALLVVSHDAAFLDAIGIERVIMLGNESDASLS